MANIKTDIKYIVNYLWEDEKRHFEELDKLSRHIFLRLQKVKKWLNRPANKKPKQ